MGCSKYKEAGNMSMAEEEFTEIMTEVGEILLELQVCLLSYELIKATELLKIAQSNIEFIEAENFFAENNIPREAFDVVKAEIERIDKNVTGILQ